MSKKPIKITLFHANWCDYCQNFLPLWNEMKSDKETTKNIEFEEYEDTKIGDLPEKIRSCDGVDVRTFGYPAIKISIGDKDYMYTGKRTAEKIYGFILDKINNPKQNDKELKGGTNSKRLITLNDFKFVFDNTHLLKPFKFIY